MRFANFTFSRLVCLGFSLLFVFVGCANASDLVMQERALEIIDKFAGNICGTIPLEGNDMSLQLSGKVDAELDGLLKKIAKLGIDGATKYQREEWKGVLQKDIADILNKNSDCKKEIAKNLCDKLLSPISEPEKSRKNQSGSVQQNTTGYQSPAINAGGDVNVNYGK